MIGKAALIWCPFGNEAEARETLEQLLNERLVACGNILPGVYSAFLWEGKRDHSAECGVLFKTAAARLDAAMTRLEHLHSYDRPAISGWTVRASAGTIDWLEAETGTRAEAGTRGGGRDPGGGRGGGPAGRGAQ